MFVPVTVAAGALSFASVETPSLGVHLFGTALSLRMATVDFSLAGDQIEVRGMSLQEAIHPFNPKRLRGGRPIFG